MSEILPRHILEGLETARRAGGRRQGGWRVEFGGRSVPVLRRWSDGFVIEDAAAPVLPGLVDLYEGARHVARCLVVASDACDGERTYEIKRATPVSEVAPRDFADDPPPATVSRPDPDLPEAS